MTLIYFVSRSNYSIVFLTGIFTCMELVFFFKVKKIVDTTHVDRSQRQLSHSFEGFPVQKDSLLKTRAKELVYPVHRDILT